jgi:hypothetical protein
VFVGWLLLLRWRDQRTVKASQKPVALDLALVLLVVPTLAIAIAPQELTPLPLDSLNQYTGTIAPALVFVSLLAALGLRRQWFGARSLAGAVALLRLAAEFVRLVKLPGLFQFGAHAGEAQIGALLLLVPAMIVLQFGVVSMQLALGALLLHPTVRSPAQSTADPRRAAKFKPGFSGVLALTMIVLITIAATPKVRQISVLLAQRAVYQHQLEKEKRIKRENIADMQNRAATEAAATFDALQQEDMPFATLSAKDVTAFIATTTAADCDVRIWRKDDIDGWNKPRIVWRLSMLDINADRLKLDVSAVAHGLDGAPLRYTNWGLHMPPSDADMDATHRVIEVSRETLQNATNFEHGSSLFFLLGAKPIVGGAAYNKGSDYEHADARHIAAYSFAFYPSWNEQDRALFKQPGSYSFDLVTDDPRIEEPMAWREWIVIRSDDSVLVAVDNPPGLEARLADASQMLALRKLLPPNYYNISEGGAEIRLTGMHRLSATITDLNLQKRQIDLLQKKMPATWLVARIEEGASDVSDDGARVIRSKYRDAPAMQMAASCEDKAPAPLSEAVRQLIRQQ